MKKARFQGGYNGSTYVCRACGKRTRDTGAGEKEVELCRKCFLLTELENGFLDGHMTEEEYNKKRSEILLKESGGLNQFKLGGVMKIEKIGKDLYRVNLDGKSIGYLDSDSIRVTWFTKKEEK